jgi:hypothetical protein
MRKVFGILLVLALTGCGTGIYQVQNVAVNRQVKPLDMREAVLIHGLENLPYSEAGMFVENIQRQLRSNGFMETYSTEEIEVELLSAGIPDLSVQRNVDRLYTELGIVYLLQVDVLRRKKAGVSKLSALAAANRGLERNNLTMYHYPESKHIVDLQYSLYQVNLSDTVAVYRVRAEHKWDNTFRPGIIRRDIQKLIDHCNLGLAL